MRMLDYSSLNSLRQHSRKSRGLPKRVEPTLLAVGHEKLASLCDATGMSDEYLAAATLFDLFAASWGSRTRTMVHPDSDITDDGSPFEFSLALEQGRPELRMLAEAQGCPATPASNWSTAWQLTETLERVYGVSIDRARSIADLFAPDAQTEVFSLWHAGCLRPGRPPELKLYFNPYARGEGRVEATMQAAFERLGQTACLEWIREHAMLREGQDRYVYFSLDLGSHDEARTKVYIAHRNATAADVEHVMAAAPTHVAGDALRFCDAMTGHRGPFGARPLLTCMAFVGQEPTPRTVTLHLPIRCYVESEQVALDRVSAFLAPIDAAIHERAVRALIDRPLSEGTGMQTYSSFRRTVSGQERLTVYLSPEVYTSAP